MVVVKVGKSGGGGGQKIKIFRGMGLLADIQGYSSSYETGQSVGGAKTGRPREKPPATPAGRTWLVAYMCPV